MIIPHLHFKNNCIEAIKLYVRAFNTKAETIILNREYSPECDDDGVAHAVMNIHGQKIFLNDRFGKNDSSTDVAIHLIVMFPSKKDFMDCYNIMKEGSTIIDPLETLPYSALNIQFIDKFGVQWGFMIDEYFEGDDIL